MDLAQINQKRFEKIAEKGCLSSQKLKLFQELEIELEEGANKNWLDAFHKNNGQYPRLLEQVLESLIKLGEPHAQKKYNSFLEEKGTMAPAVFLTPWDMTLEYLDKNIGDIAEIKKFYGL